MSSLVRTMSRSIARSQGQVGVKKWRKSVSRERQRQEREKAARENGKRDRKKLGQNLAARIRKVLKPNKKPAPAEV